MSGADDVRRAAVLDLTRQALAAVGEGRIAVSDKTQSMAPVLRGGEVLHWRRRPGPPRVGDLLIFIQRPGPIVHRVIARRGDRVRTKGDARMAPDAGLVRADELLGTVHAIETGRGLVLLSGPGARLYALLATALSVAGALLHDAARAGDAALRRVPRWGEREVLRRPAWWIQAGGQRALHALLFRACHRVREVPAEQEPGQQDAPAGHGAPAGQGAPAGHGAPAGQDAHAGHDASAGPGRGGETG